MHIYIHISIRYIYIYLFNIYIYIRTYVHTYRQTDIQACMHAYIHTNNIYIQYVYGYKYTIYMYTQTHRHLNLSQGCTEKCWESSEGSPFEWDLWDFWDSMTIRVSIQSWNCWPIWDPYGGSGYPKRSYTSTGASYIGICFVHVFLQKMRMRV